MTTQDDSQTLWAQYTQTVAAEMGKGASVANIQTLPAAELLQGKDATDFDKSISEFVEVVPQWGSTYEPSDANVIQSYQVVLTQAQETATNGKAIQKEYQAEQKVLSSMMGKASDFKTSKITGWMKVKEEYKKAGLKAPQFVDWFKDNGLQEYQALLDQQQAQTTKVATLLEAEGIASPLIEALAALNKELKKAESDLAVPVTANPGGELLAGWKTNKTDPVTLGMDNHTASYDYSDTKWQTQSGVKLFGFISIGYREQSGEQQNILSTSSTYDLKMAFDASASPVIAQGNWFDGAVLKEYKDGPWIPGSQFATGKAHPYGDADAVFPLLITRLYVVLNPSITITLDNKSFESVYSNVTTNQSDGVNLGPFAFGGSRSKVTNISQATRTSDDTQSFTVSDTSGVPQIIAVANQVMP